MYGDLQLHPVVRQFLDNLSIEREFADSVQDAAKKLGVSSSHLQHLLKKSTGSSFTELVRTRRTDMARALLTSQPHLIISEIAYQLGVSPQTLTRDFVRLYGISPAELRRIERKGAMRRIAPSEELQKARVG